MNLLDCCEILIADENKDNLKTLQEQLEALKCNIISVRDGLDAWEKIFVNNPNLILINTSLPGLDGYELCRRLKNDKKAKNIPVILIGESGEPFDKIKGFQ